jgi:rRNA maturation endonuclease Nob1
MHLLGCSKTPDYLAALLPGVKRHRQWVLTEFAIVCTQISRIAKNPGGRLIACKSGFQMKDQIKYVDVCPYCNKATDMYKPECEHCHACLPMAHAVNRKRAA